MDSHCHLALIAPTALAATLQRAASTGVQALLAVATREQGPLGDWALTAQRAQMARGFGIDARPAFGWHPWFLEPQSAGPGQAELDRLAGRLRGAAALGECGLDGRLCRRGGADRRTQEAWLIPQLELAQQLDLPVSLHGFAAWDWIAALLRRHPVRAVAHGFDGSRQQAEALCRIGCRLGVGLAITRPRQQRLRALFAALPAECLLIETDAPDQAPDALHAAGEPADLERVLAALATCRNVNRVELTAQLDQTTRALFFPELPADAPARPLG